MLATSLGTLYYYAVKALKFPHLTALGDVFKNTRVGAINTRIKHLLYQRAV
jgi:hypothetical protein